METCVKIERTEGGESGSNTFFLLDFPGQSQVESKEKLSVRGGGEKGKEDRPREIFSLLQWGARY